MNTKESRQAEENVIIGELAAKLEEAFPETNFIIKKSAMNEFAHVTWKKGPTVSEVSAVTNEDFGAFTLFRRLLEKDDAIKIIDEFDERYGTSDLYKTKKFSVASDEDSSEINGFSFTFGSRVFSPENSSSTIESKKRDNWLSWNFDNRKFA